MRIEKRKKYIENIIAAIHTISGKADWVNDDVAVNNKAIKSCVPKKVPGKDRREFYLQMNLNTDKTIPSGSMIRSYGQFQEILLKTLDSIQATGFRITRADLAIDMFNDGDYQTFQKLNKLILCCLADAINIKNCYSTRDLWTNQSLSVAIKNDSIEAENYDKAKESDGKSKATNRLELRSKRIMRPLDEEFLAKWALRLDHAVEHFEDVQVRYNTELAALWNEDRKKPENCRDYVSLKAFLVQFQDCIFTRSQLRNLLEIIGVENAERAAKNFKDRHHVEFYSKKDLITVIEGIKSAMLTYFEN